MPDLAPELWGLAVAITLAAGFVKGVVGFGMPMLMISGLASIMDPALALALLILPTVATNLWQAVRGGLAAARASCMTHWRFLAVLLLAILISAQLINVLPKRAILLLLGLPVVLFAGLQFAGWRLRFPPEAKRRVEVAVAGFAGFVGGLSGVWGPPTVLYLTALDTEKRESVRVQGVVYGAGAVMLALSHIRSGVLTLETAAGSAAMLVPALAGMSVGVWVHDRIDQALFRKLTLAVLILAGLNLVRRALAM